MPVSPSQSETSIFRRFKVHLTDCRRLSTGQISLASGFWHPEILGWAFALRRRGRCSLPEQKPAHVAGDVCEADFGAGSGDADGADEQPHAVLLVGKDMLDAGPFPRAGGVGLLAWRRHRLAG